MKRIELILLLLVAVALSSCNNYQTMLKHADNSYKYEVAKQYYMQGWYNRAALILNDVITPLKGTDRGEESLFLMGMSNLKAKNYDAAASSFQTYYKNYPRGIYAEQARYNSGMALYESTPSPKLDQTATYEAVTEFSNFIEEYPTSPLRAQAQERIFELQDKLVEKEYLSAKLYYDLGSYFTNGGNGNYNACIVTAENAIKDFPYSKRREDFAFLILKAKFEFAQISVEDKKEERYHAAIDEYYGFQSEYPESKYMKEANSLFEHTPKAYKRTSADKDETAQN